jgi:hypothetical protein
MTVFSKVIPVSFESNDSNRGFSEQEKAVTVRMINK